MTEETQSAVSLLVDPLIQRRRAGRPAIVLARIDGDLPDPGFLEDLNDRVSSEDLNTRTLPFSDLGEAPVSRLIEIQRADAIDLFFVVFAPEDLVYDSELNARRVAALNLKRSAFTKAGLCVAFLTPRGGARFLHEHASNLLDFRLRSLDIPGVDAPHKAETPVATVQNLPFPSLGEGFIGREDELQHLEQRLHEQAAVTVTQPEAIKGLGGVGKTRLALEFAWRNMSRYDAVLFARADTPGDLTANLAALASPLGLDTGSTSIPDLCEIVMRWFEEHGRWLLILDNADEPLAIEAVRNIAPRLSHGHLLVTSRSREWGAGVADTTLDALSPEEAAQFLLLHSRHGRLERNFDERDANEHARELSKELGHFPLALELAAAYIRRNGISLGRYLEEWDTERRKLLRWRQPEKPGGYPHSVAGALERSIQQISPAALNILRLIAWLAPDPIPKDLVLEAGKFSDATMVEPEAKATTPATGLDELDRFSMIRQVSETFSIHRLIQEVIRDRIPQIERRDWVERTLRLVDTFTPRNPPPDDVRSWGYWNVMHPHVAAIAQEADHREIADPTTRLMSELGLYYHARAQWGDAELMFRRALEIDEVALGPDHPGVAIRLHNLALSLQDASRFDEAETMYRRALMVYEETFGPDHPNSATSLNNLATLLRATGRLSEAESLVRRALKIDEAYYGPDHPDVARGLNNLAQLLQSTNRLAEAEPLMRRVVEIYASFLGENHPSVADALNNLAQLLKDTNRLEEAEWLTRRALEIRLTLSREVGRHPHTDVVASNYAGLLREMGRTEEDTREKLKALLAEYGTDFGEGE